MLNSKSGLLGRPEEYLNAIFYTPWWLVIPFGALLLLAGIVMVPYQRKTLYCTGMYRERLIRAYLGASSRNRNENPFTGFDENDNIKCGSLAAGKISLQTDACYKHRAQSGFWRSWLAGAQRPASPLHGISDAPGLLFYSRRGWYCYLPEYIFALDLLLRFPAGCQLLTWAITHRLSSPSS